MKVLVFIFLLLLPICISGQSKNKELFSSLEEMKNPPVKKDVWLGKDKLQHLWGSFILTGAASYYCRHRQKWSDENSVVFGVGFTFSMGLAKEIRDGSLPDRGFSWKDLIGDVAGIGLGVIFLSWW
jgi:uncharacterized protein YfiM (DUF2279 family)